ncbi:YjbQ family protein [candidate division KSB1 bacterium]|nr:YjbQ family protein [bacterium]RKY77654.1 MAG: YjbQ family protein [candidate division KSB1 bacterium]RKY81570.1 MAG: YjbQ family protein [candidate division KSB1 bacterium]RKY82820.1 MAG: YjbQ family protein [candidate division KSB1 bacterium]RKY91673.1 MAG: YjbQ family protein [candidate division KSB1 bacterium]
MKIITKTIEKRSRGFTDIIDITHDVQNLVHASEVQNGQVLVFIPGSTAGITTIEYEPGLLQDLPELFEKIAPQNKRYHHDATWHDGNGYAHLRAALLGASLIVPIQNRQLVLGTWQQIVVVDFDNRPRSRRIVAQISGE